MNRNEIMEWFRDGDNIDDKLNALSTDDRYEIALHCLSHSDALFRLLEAGIELREGN